MMALSILFGAVLLGRPRLGRAEGDDSVCHLFSCGLFSSCCDAGGGDEDKEEEKKSYGPCDCQPRKTLMQWSYGTSFSGGPPGMDEPLSGDRPGFTTPPTTVGRGVAQVEMGYQFTTDRSGNTRTNDQSFPQMEWRLGMFADWFEFRITYNYEIQDTTDLTVPGPAGRQRQSGSDDILLGAKIGLTPQEGILPAMAVVPQMSVPTGSEAFTSKTVMPGLIWCYQWEITKVVSLGMSTEIDRERDDNGNVFTQFDQSASVGYQLNKDLSAYTEVFLLSPSGHTIEKVQYYFDGGFAYHITNNVQVDIEAGLGLNDAADDFFVGSGLVLRF